MPRRLLASATLAATIALAAPAAVADPVDTSLAGWAGRCDAGVCRASRPSVSGLQALLLGRLDGGDGVALGFATPGAIADRSRPVTVRLDGQLLGDVAPTGGYAPFERVEAFWFTDPRFVDTLLAKAKGAKTLRIEYIDVTGAPFDADFDLAGLAPILAWTDGVLGRTTAKPVGAAPKGLAAAPDIGRAELVIRQGVPPRLAEKHRAASSCEAPDSPLLRAFKPVIGVLSSTAILYAIPCTASAGNVSYRLWVVESGEIGGITPLYFASFDPQYGWKGSDLAYNVAYDERNQRLTSTFRAGGGCGSRGVWRWQKWAFAMEESRTAADCVEGRDPGEWPRVWPTDKP